MIEDQITKAIQSLIKLRTEHRDIKKDITEEKKKALEPHVDLTDLVKARKELTKQINDKKREVDAELNENDFFHQLRESLVLKEEEIQQEKGKLFEFIDKLGKNTPVEMRVELEDGSLVKFQMIPAKNVYLNGKEEKQD